MSDKTTQLTDVQQMVIDSYDRSIARQQALKLEAERAWVNGASYDDVRYHDREIERLSQWRREELEAYQEKKEDTVSDDPQPAIDQLVNLLTSGTLTTEQIHATLNTLRALWLAQESN